MATSTDVQVLRDDNGMLLRDFRDPDRVGCSLAEGFRNRKDFNAFVRNTCLKRSQAFDEPG